MMAEATSAVTVVGNGRQTDLTLPSSVAVAELLPELVGLLDEHPNGSHPPKHWSLHRLGGEALDGERSLEGQGVLDGTMLLLCDTSAVPPPPVVEDISEYVASAVDARPGRWAAETSRVLLLWAGGVQARAGRRWWPAHQASARHGRWPPAWHSWLGQSRRSWPASGRRPRCSRLLPCPRGP